MSIVSCYIYLQQGKISKSNKFYALPEYLEIPTMNFFIGYKIGYLR